MRPQRVSLEVAGLSSTRIIKLTGVRWREITRYMFPGVRDAGKREGACLQNDEMV